MNSVEFPLGAPIFKESKILEEYYGFCYAKITSHASRGLLPYRFHGMLITPYGTFEGWYYSEELKLAKAHGAVVKVLYGYHWNERGPIFTNFINKFADF